jgi:hypothetical protein
MKSSATFRLRLVWQRRLSGVLSAALCMWLLAFAAHLHASDQEAQDGRTGTHYCSVCASIPSAAAAPTVVVSPAISDREEFVSTAPDAQVPNSPTVASYRSRAPPAR